MQKPLTIKEVAERIGVSEGAVRHNIEALLAVLPLRQRILVLEHLDNSKRLGAFKKRRR